MSNSYNTVQHRKSGFTLVEIMIVVVIIGLLAAMAIPAFQKVRERSQGNAIANDLKNIADAVEAFSGTYGFPTDDLTTDATAAPAARYTKTMEALTLPEEFAQESPLGNYYVLDAGTATGIVERIVPVRGDDDFTVNTSWALDSLVVELTPNATFNDAIAGPADQIFDNGDGATSGRFTWTAGAGPLRLELIFDTAATVD